MSKSCAREADIDWLSALHLVIKLCQLRSLRLLHWINQAVVLICSPMVVICGTSPVVPENSIGFSVKVQSMTLAGRKDKDFNVSAVNAVHVEGTSILIRALGPTRPCFNELAPYLDEASRS